MEAYIGWGASLVLLSTLIAQSVKQFKAASIEAVSPLLFAGQIVASFGFVVYSVGPGGKYDGAEPVDPRDFYEAGFRFRYPSAPASATDGK